MRRLLVLTIAASQIALGGVAAAETLPCKQDPRIIQQCFAVHGRLSVHANMRAYLWPIGTNRLLGVANPDGAIIMPAELERLFSVRIARENTAEAIGLYERALALDPRSVEAQSRLARALVSRGLSAAPEAERVDFERAAALINQALPAAPQYPLAHVAKAQLFRAQRRCEDAVPEYEMAFAVDRNLVGSLLGLAQCKFLTGGSDDESIRLTEQAIRLSPRDSFIAFRYFWIGFVHLLQSRTDEAIAGLEKARRADPKIAPPHYFLAGAYGLKGELDRAAAELTEAERLTGSDRYSTIARVRANGDLNTPAVRDRFEGVFLAGLRKAGMPEE